MEGVVPLLSETNPDDVAQLTRAHFGAAGCTRPTVDGAERGGTLARLSLVVRRGITRSIVLGDDVVKVQRHDGLHRGG